jgi:ferredoxin
LLSLEAETSRRNRNSGDEQIASTALNLRLVMPTVRFIKDGKLLKEVYVAADSNLRKAAIANDVFVNDEVPGIGWKFGCMGMSVCGTCGVTVKAGAENLSKQSGLEKARLSISSENIGREESYRLACRTMVNGDCEVEVNLPSNFVRDKFWESKPQAFNVHAGSKEASE